MRLTFINIAPAKNIIPIFLLNKKIAAAIAKKKAECPDGKE